MSIGQEAGRLKVAYKISLADSIALAQTLVVDGALLTCDHHEFDIIVGKENIRFAWIRKKGLDTPTPSKAINRPAP